MENYGVEELSHAETLGTDGGIDPNAIAVSMVFRAFNNCNFLDEAAAYYDEIKNYKAAVQCLQKIQLTCGD